MKVLIRTISLRIEEGGGTLTVSSMCQALGERVRDPVCNQAQGRLPGLPVYVIERVDMCQRGAADRCILSIARHAVRVPGGSVTRALP